MEFQAGVQISNKEVAVKPKFVIHDGKNEVAFIYASSSLDASRNFESCLSIRCLAPQHLFRFPHFCRGFFPMLLATFPIIVSSSSTFHCAIEIRKSVCNGLPFPGNLDPLSLTPGGLIVPLI